MSNHELFTFANIFPHESTEEQKKIHCSANFLTGQEVIILMSMYLINNIIFDWKRYHAKSTSKSQKRYQQIMYTLSIIAFWIKVHTV